MDFPVLSKNGKTAVFAKYNYSTLTMTYYLALKERNYFVTELFNNKAIGPVRLTDDGKGMAYFSSDGAIFSWTQASIPSNETSITSPSSAEPGTIDLGLTLSLLPLMVIPALRRRGRGR